MARVGIVFGLLLCGLTYAALVLTNNKLPIQFIPMMIGIPTLFCGVVALNPHRRKQAMQSVAALALLGTLVGGIRSCMWLARWGSDKEFNSYAFGLSLALFAISATLLTIWGVAFVMERRRRHAQRERQIPPPIALAGEAQKVGVPGNGD
jgi:uncharacterized membrane protein